jgi:hypothetical protein
VAGRRLVEDLTNASLRSHFRRINTRTDRDIALRHLKRGFPARSSWRRGSGMARRQAALEPRLAATVIQASVDRLHLPYLPHSTMCSFYNTTPYYPLEDAV